MKLIFKSVVYLEQNISKLKLDLTYTINIHFIPTDVLLSVKYVSVA